jgi:hypothetical protein
MKENSPEDFDSLFVKKRSGLKVFALIFCLLLLIITGVYAYLSVGAVRDRMQLAKTQAEGSIVDPSLIGLMKDKAWVESRVKMAANDSVGLSIDLEQHTIQLELKGVVLMKTKIKEYSTSGFFKRMDGNVYFAMFGTPLTIQRYVSSINRNPFKVIQAPKTKTAAEIKAEEEAPYVAAKPVPKDSIPKENVFWTVKLDRAIDLNIQGIDSISESQSKYKLGKGFEFERDLNNILKSFQHILKFEKPTYTPEILISIPENDAKAILRALPSNASVTIRI